MTDFISKFNLNDTAYSINKETLSLESVVITDIRIRQSLSVAPSYLVSYRGRTSTSQKDFEEADLYFLNEGKDALEAIISNRVSTLRGMH